MQYRFGTNATITPVISWPAIDDSGAARGDFQFSTALEASWMQLGRRVNYPGFASSGTPFSAFQLGDAIGLAHDFLIRNPSSAYSQLEQHLPMSLVFGGDPAYPIPTSPYAPSATLTAGTTPALRSCSASSTAGFPRQPSPCVRC